MSEHVRVSTLVGRTLAKLGVGHVFGVVGSGNFDVTGTLMAEGIPFTAARHEGGAATMADAYSRMSGKVGVVTTHQGCGLSNAITGIGEAAKSRTPMIVLTADTQAAAIRSNFKIDQDGLARSVAASSRADPLPRHSRCGHCEGFPDGGERATHGGPEPAAGCPKRRRCGRGECRRRA
jgi:thiamine pyrophosphate-dependent acetolactate synthase large subunit-like protein